MRKFRRRVYTILTSSKNGRSLVQKAMNLFFPGSKNYWENRYYKKGNSGSGCYGKKVAYKAAVLNQYVEKYKIQKVIELGCGDDNQLKQFRFPEYIGFDVSATAIKLCQELFKEDNSKQFFLYNEGAIDSALSHFKAELALSLDVIYHLVEDEVYEEYMNRLFSIPSRFVIIYAWDLEEGRKYHVRHRNFSKWITNNIKGFELRERISQPPYCDFFVYGRM